MPFIMICPVILLCLFQHPLFYVNCHLLSCDSSLYVSIVYLFYIHSSFSSHLHRLVSLVVFTLALRHYSFSWLVWERYSPLRLVRNSPLWFTQHSTRVARWVFTSPSCDTRPADPTRVNFLLEEESLGYLGVSPSALLSPVRLCCWCWIWTGRWELGG